MSQRVSIQYSVDLDELDVEVQRLIKSSLIHIQYITDQCSQIDQIDPLTIKNCELIDEIRARMAKTDQGLNEVANIINGYLNYKSSTAITGGDSSQLSHVSELSQKMEDFKNSIDQMPDEIST